VIYGALDGSGQSLGGAGDLDAGALQAVNSATGAGGACDPIAAGPYENMAKVWAAQLQFLSQAACSLGTGTISASGSYRGGDATGAGAYQR
jgi:hypothetical protein